MGNRDNLGHGRSPATARAPQRLPGALLPPSALLCSVQTASPGLGSGNPPQSAPRRALSSKMGGTAHLSDLAPCSSSLAALIFLTAGTGPPSGLGAVHCHPSWDMGAARHLWSGERCPCTWQGVGTGWLWPLRSLLTHTIPWFCGLTPLCRVPGKV